MAQFGVEWSFKSPVFVFAYHAGNVIVMKCDWRTSVATLIALKCTRWNARAVLAMGDFALQLLRYGVAVECRIMFCFMSYYSSALLNFE